MSRVVAASIAEAGINQVDPYRIVLEAMRRDRDRLTITGFSGRDDETGSTYHLDRYDTLYLIGAGKAGAPMARAVEHLLSDRITDGVVVVKHGHGGPVKKIRLIEAGHPIPDDNSIRGAEQVLAIADGADEKTLIINVLSGGGSALLAAPIRTSVGDADLEDLSETTKLLLGCGAPIQDVNTVRKHLSGIKGGRLAARAYPATVLTLILSDVVGDDLSSIASGITAPDTGTYEDAWNLVNRYGILDRLPGAVRQILQAGRDGELPDTPKADDPVFGRVRNIVIGNNRQALSAAARSAEAQGYRPVVLTSQLVGETREIARVFAAIAKDVVETGLLAMPPLCVLAGGETTVTLTGNGQGGRNQELSLAFLSELAYRPDVLGRTTFLSAATDGTDGPTDAAGGFSDLECLNRARTAGYEPREFLADNDSYRFFDALDALYKTGPTGTNVCDLQILIIA